MVYRREFGDRDPLWKVARRERTMRTVKTAFVASVFCFACTLLSAQSHGVRAVTGRDGLGILVLSDGARFKTSLYHLKVIGELRATHKSSYYVLSGVGCTECDANTSIYIHSPDDGPMKDESQQQRFAYPGIETDIEDGHPSYKARMFLGNCIANHPNAAIWFERFMGEDGRWHSDVTVAEVNSDKLVVKQMHRNLLTIEEAIKSVAAGDCKEVPGINRGSEP